MEIQMSYWQVFTAIGFILMALEVVVPGFVMLPMGLGFLATAGAAFFIHDGPTLVAILGGCQFAIYLLFKNFFMGGTKKTNAYTNVEGMMGKEVEVLESIGTKGTGYVKLYGDHWLAESADGTAHEKGSRVVIVKVEGNKVFVESIN